LTPEAFCCIQNEQREGNPFRIPARSPAERRMARGFLGPVIVDLRPGLPFACMKASPIVNCLVLLFRTQLASRDFSHRV
jgi:hypothetical protein